MERGLRAGAHAPQAVGEAGGKVVEALFTQVLALLKGQISTLAFPHRQRLPIVDECRDSVLFDEVCQGVVAAAAFGPFS